MEELFFLFGTSAFFIISTRALCVWFYCVVLYQARSRKGNRSLADILFAPDPGLLLSLETEHGTVVGQ